MGVASYVVVYDSTSMQVLFAQRRTDRHECNIARACVCVREYVRARARARVRMHCTRPCVCVSVWVCESDALVRVARSRRDST
jgi:hypothetical protein